LTTYVLKEAPEVLIDVSGVQQQGCGWGRVLPRRGDRCTLIGKLPRLTRPPRILRIYLTFAHEGCGHAEPSYRLLTNRETMYIPNIGNLVI